MKNKKHFKIPNLMILMIHKWQRRSRFVVTHQQQILLVFKATIWTAMPGAAAVFDDFVDRVLPTCFQMGGCPWFVWKTNVLQNILLVIAVFHVLYSGCAPKSKINGFLPKIMVFWPKNAEKIEKALKTDPIRVPIS